MLHGLHDHDEEEERPKSKPAKKESSNKDAVADTTQQAPAKDSKPLALSLPQLGIQANVAAAQSQPDAAADGKEDAALKIGGGGRKQSGAGHIKMMPISTSFGRIRGDGLKETEEDAETKAKGITAEDIEEAGEASQNETRGVRTVPEGDAGAQSSKVAFEASLRVNSKVAAQPSQPNRQAPQKIEAGDARQQAKTEDAHAPRPANAPASANKRDDGERERQDHSSKSDDGADTPAGPLKDSPAVAAPLATAVDPTIAAAAAHAAGHGAQPTSRVDAPAAPASSPAPTSTSEAAAPADPAPATAPTTDIKIAVGDGAQRVELRISERAGDIHVAVKTPDSQLANALRNDLPSLSTKLEQSGFHADMWRPEASSGELRTAETANANTSSDSNQEPGGRHQSEQEQQQQRNQQQQQQQNLYRKTAGKEFSWFFESIR
jgi:hypothetical protein